MAPHQSVTAMSQFTNLEKEQAQKGDYINKKKKKQTGIDKYFWVNIIQIISEVQVPLTMASALHIQMPNYSKPLALLRSKEHFSLSSLLSVYSYHLGINDCLMLKEQNSANIIFRRLLA